MKETSVPQNIDAQLESLSERIRALRARRGMTRKSLSHHSDISERYLAQLESGKANPSVALLWRIANAMDINFLELLREDGGMPRIYPPLWSLLQGMTYDQGREAYELLQGQFATRQSTGHHGVALIGLRGAGKTTLGRMMADEFKVPFIRLGQIIEELGGMKLAETFALGGQKAYRRLERRAIEHVMAQYPTAVVETGGSLVSEIDTFNLLRSNYFTVWMRASAEDHMNRVIQQGDLRPMQGNDQSMDDLNRILKERDPYYRTADRSIYTSGRSKEDCLAELGQVCGPYLREQADSVSR